MAKFVIAGADNCPYFAKLELLADSLARNLPDFKLHKILKKNEEWSVWLDTICKENRWVHYESPIVWRELVERGGKGKLIGGFNEFMEYAKCYYNFESDMKTEMMIKIRDENILQLALQQIDERNQRSKIKPKKFCIINSKNRVAYHLCPLIANGDILGSDKEVSICLYDSGSHEESVKAMLMETFDLCSKPLRKVSVSNTLQKAVKNAFCVIILDDENLDRNPEENKIDWVERNRKKFKKYAKVFADNCAKTTKIIVTGRGLVNFQTMILQTSQQVISDVNIVACSSNSEARAKSVLAKKLQVHPSDIKDLIIWGNSSNEADLDTYHIEHKIVKISKFNGAIWGGPKWFSRPLLEVVCDRKWLKSSFMTSHHDRKGLVESMTGKFSWMSEAVSIGSLMKKWFSGYTGDEIFSLGVQAKGQYGIHDCVFSLPVKFQSGFYKVVDDLPLSEEGLECLKAIEANLEDLYLEDPEENELTDKESSKYIEEKSKSSSEKLDRIDEEISKSSNDIEEEEEDAAEDVAEDAAEDVAEDVAEDEEEDLTQLETV